MSLKKAKVECEAHSVTARLIFANEVVYQLSMAVSSPINQLELVLNNVR